ncbi:MAG: aldose epimerase family protein [Acidimicrobiales bacterium]|jgi:aldose 1-epimerase
MDRPTITAAPGGTEGVFLYTLSNTNAMIVKIFNYGGIVQSISFPDRRGESADVTLGFSSLSDYQAYNPAPHATKLSGAGVYFGAIVGRFANRIAGGEFALGGTSYRVPPNNGPNALHGGTTGFDQKIWAPVTSSGPDSVSLQLTYLSAKGEMGFPGTLNTVATYTLDDENRLTLSISATTSVDTVVNLTNHTYWNLAGEASGEVHDQLLYINAETFTPVDETLIPTGEIKAVAGTPFDFTTLTEIGRNLNGGTQFGAADNEQLQRCSGYDHNWVLNRTGSPSLLLAAQAVDPKSGRELTIHTTEPGLQFYAGGSLSSPSLVGKSGRLYGPNAGFALETQHFPDSPNRPGFPSTELKVGERYNQVSVYQLSIRR